MSSPKPVVIVHGAWGGGWSWRGAAQSLRGQGIEIFVATLTGLGERVHLGQPTTSLDDHVLDVEHLITAEELNDVILVGHSYGGMVITGVAERVPDRIAHLIYLDAFVPRDGDALLDLVQPSARQTLEAAFAESDDGWRIHYPTDARPRPRPEPTPRDSPQPWRTFTQPLTVSNPAAARIPRLYVRATADKQPGLFMTESFVTSYARVREDDWPRREVAIGHSDMADAPETVEIITHIAANG